MSVIMTLRVQADPSKLEEMAAGDPDALRSISERARDKHGCIGHRFYGSDDGQVMVIDEWPAPENFQAFFDEESEAIQAHMGAMGVTSEPEITFWRKLDTRDDIGWGA